MSNPTDIVLILDRSGSMEGQPLADLKMGVNTFIDIIAGATGGAPSARGSAMSLDLSGEMCYTEKNTPDEDRLMCPQTCGSSGSKIGRQEAAGRSC